jgi:dihydrofolate reductase
MPTVSVFCGVSLDGFLARADGAFDFLDEGGAEPHGYTEFMATVDTLVVGRNTYEIVEAFPEWPYEEWSGRRCSYWRFVVKAVWAAPLRARRFRRRL